MEKLSPIKTKKDYENALKKVDRLAFSKKKEDIETLEVLVKLIDQYENEHFNILPPDPIEAIKFRIEQMGIRQTDLAPLFGGKNRVSEVLRGKRELTIKMIYRLHKYLKTPYTSLIRETPKLKLRDKALKEFRKRISNAAF